MKSFMSLSRLSNADNISDLVFSSYTETKSPKRVRIRSVAKLPGFKILPSFLKKFRSIWKCLDSTDGGLISSDEPLGGGFVGNDVPYI